ncbi:peptidase S15 [Hyaloraphidium curvatum]|nr:peptidase S15 [Hyaloraphidium curvatum]
MSIVTAFPRRVVEEEDMGIPMPDGVRLSARAWIPEDAVEDPVPAVLEMIPYRKRDGTVARDALMHPYLAGHGFACVRVDMRGNGDSGGIMEDEYTQQEMDDVVEVISWLARQPWCTGAVGMMGKSWGGFNSLQAAFNRPPALRAVIAVCATADRYADDIHFKGGCLMGENFGWAAVMLSYSSRPADPLLRPDWRDDWLRRLEANPWLAPRWASHQARDDYWKHGSVCEAYSRIAVPTMIVGGWADGYVNAVDALLRGVRAPCRGIVGPWVHQYPHTAVPGPQIGFLQEALRWWDRWLKGADNGVERDAALRAYILHSALPDACASFKPGHWIAEASWPSPRVSDAILHLHPAQDGRIGRLVEDTLSGELRTTICTPQHLGMFAGEFFPMGLNAEMPGDQAEDDALSVCFDGLPFSEPLTLLGGPVVRLRLASDRPHAFVVARLCDVAPDGKSARITHGVLNLCHRAGMGSPAPVIPGEMMEVEVVLDMAGYRLSTGHRLRLALSNTYWPLLWPSPQRAKLTLGSGMLTLPVHVGGTEDAWTPLLPEHARPWEARTLRPGTAARRIERDLIRGTAALVVESDEGIYEDASHKLVGGERSTERWEIAPDDPLSARVVHVWEQERSRGEWRIRTRAEAEMTATLGQLRMRAKLVAWDGNLEVFRREWDDEVERRFV